MAKRGRRRTFAAQYPEERAQFDMGGSSNPAPNAAFIDHRDQDDLANFQLLPARRRRRNTHQSTNQMPVHLPLTNRNLQSLLTQGTAADRNYGAVALDMDQYTSEQRQLSNQTLWHLGLQADVSGGPHEDDLDGRLINSQEFGGLNPSLDHSSDLTSLDDVCFPDYYGEDDIKDRNVWPDLKVLEEFVHDELEEYYGLHHEKEMETGVNFNYPIAHSIRSGSDSEVLPTSRFPTNMASRESTPLMGNTHVDDMANISNETFRVRPTPIQPWEKSKEHIPTILNQQEPYPKLLGRSKVDPLLCRFTYFREDLDKTIHSPTLSGLLAKGVDNIAPERTTPLSKKWHGSRSEQQEPENREEDGEDEQMTLEDLFLPTYYSLKLTETSSESGPDGGALSPAPQEPAISTGLSRTQNLSSNNLQVNFPPQFASIAGKSILRDTDQAPPSAAVSVSGKEIGTNPFWLDVLNPTEEEMKVLSKTFGIHPLTTEDIFLGEAREKVELFKSYYFICFTSFDVVYERRKQRAKEQEKKMNKLQEMYDGLDDDNSIFRSPEKKYAVWKMFRSLFKGSNDKGNYSALRNAKGSSSAKSKTKKIREGELSPLNMYMIVFKDAVITFHFSATPHPINVRRRARLLSDYLTVSSDWISYALIDDITDSFAPMIDSIEEEVNLIEDAILKMHSGDSDSDDDSDDSDSDDETREHPHHTKLNIFYKRKRSKSTVDNGGVISLRFGRNTGTSRAFSEISRGSISKESRKSSKSSSSKSTSSKILGWKRKGDMLRRIGECRKRVMSVLRLLGSKADVIKGFSKHFTDPVDPPALAAGRNGNINGLTPKLDIGMYVSDIQDHIVTMVQSLNHYEKLLARFHSNYLAQINIDMTKVNNDTNEVLGKITILGTIVLPINVVTGLWGMNCVVPGQEYDSLTWFWLIISCMLIFSFFAYNYAKRVTGL